MPLYVPKSEAHIEKAASLADLVKLVPVLVHEFSGDMPKKYGPGVACYVHQNTDVSRCNCILCQFKAKAERAIKPTVNLDDDLI